VLLEGYDHALRAHVLRKQGEDRVRLTMHPTSPQINPVFLINGWNSPYAVVIVNGTQLRSDGFRAQVCGHDLVIWVHGRFAETTQFSFAGSRASTRTLGP
jgi:hypothetical protein